MDPEKAAERMEEIGHLLYILFKIKFKKSKNELTPSIASPEVSTPEWRPIMYGVGASI